MPSTYLLPADSERLLALIEYLERAGPVVQIKTADLAAELNMPVQAVSRYVKWAERYGVVDVTRTSAGFATGRAPNTYRLLIGLDQWTIDGPTIVAGHRARRAPDAKPPRSLPSATPMRDDVAAEVRDEAAAITAAVLADAPPLPDVPIPPPMTDDEAAYWLETS